MTKRTGTKTQTARSSRRSGQRKGATKASSIEASVFNRGDQHQIKTDAIITAAARLISENGVGGTSLDDVADKLGVTKPSVYYYVNSKEELIFLCHMRIVEQQTLAVDRAIATSGTGADKIKAFIRTYAQFVWSPDSGLPRLWQDSSLNAKRRKEVNKAYLKQAKRIGALIDGGKKDGSLFPHDSEIVERALVSSILWVPIWYNEQSLPYDREKLLEMIIELFFTGLTPK